MPDDEENWSNAQALAERVARESPHRREARQRFDQRVVRFAIALLTGAAVVAVGVQVIEPLPDSGTPATWRWTAGITVGLLGLILVGIRLGQPYGSRREWGAPMRPLSPRQREELLDHVRGRSSVPPERIRLARLEAEWRLEQSTSLAPQAGLASMYLGFWIVHRSIFATLMTVAFYALVGIGGSRALRDAHHARRFLAEHPNPED
jgi:hypothetical protein